MREKRQAGRPGAERAAAVRSAQPGTTLDIEKMAVVPVLQMF